MCQTHPPRQVSFQTHLHVSTEARKRPREIMRQHLPTLPARSFQEEYGRSKKQQIEKWSLPCPGAHPVAYTSGQPFDLWTGLLMPPPHARIGKREPLHQRQRSGKETPAKHARSDSRSRGHHASSSSQPQTRSRLTLCFANTGKQKICACPESSPLAVFVRWSYIAPLQPLLFTQLKAFFHFGIAPKTCYE